MKKSYRRILSIGMFAVLMGGLVFALTGCGLPFLNQAPVAVITTDPSSTGGTVEVNVGENIEFDGTNSHDMEGGIAAYDWDFDSNFTQHTADGEPVQSVSYNVADTYTVTLTVTDEGNKTGQDTVEVDVS